MIHPRPKISTIPPKKNKGGTNLKLTVWPSGDYSIGYSKPPKTDKGDHPLGGIQRDAFGIAWLNRPLPDNAKDLSLKDWVFLFEAFESMGRYDLASNAVAGMGSTADPENPMGLSVVSNSPISPPQRKIRQGLSGITTYQKRLIKSAGALLERGGSQGDLTLLTCTLPNISEEENERVCKNWAKLIKSFTKELNRELERFNLPGQVVGVTEIQEKRLSKWGQVCPHLHIVFKGRINRYSDWAISKERAAELWNHQIELLIGREIYGQATTRIEKPRKSLKAELGKYLTKGSKLIRHIMELGKTELLPSAWVTCTLSLRKQVKQAIKKLSNPAINNLFDRRKELQSVGVMRYRDIEVDVGDDRHSRTIVVGCAGYLQIENWRSLLFESREELDNFIIYLLEKRDKSKMLVA